MKHRFLPGDSDRHHGEALLSGAGGLMPPGLLPREAVPELAEFWSRGHRHFRTVRHLERRLRAIALAGLNNHDHAEMAVASVLDAAISGEETSELRSIAQKHLGDGPRTKKLLDLAGIGTSNSPDRTRLLRLIGDAVFEGGPSEWRVCERDFHLEHQWMPRADYLSYRMGWLGMWRAVDDRFVQPTDYIASYANKRRPTTAVFPGSFNPFHIGHLDILHKAQKTFEKVIVAVGQNPEKPAAGNLADVRATLPWHEVAAYEGYLHDFVAALSFPVTVIRGIRNTRDLGGEIAMLRTIEDLSPIPINLVMIMCDRSLEHVSSTMIRALESIDRRSGHPSSLTPYLPTVEMVYPTR